MTLTSVHKALGNTVATLAAMDAPWAGRILAHIVATLVATD